VYLSAVAKDLALDSFGEGQDGGMKFGALHGAFSATGASEIAGGIPPYARKPLAWGLATAGVKSLRGPLPTWDVPLGALVAWIGLWDALTGGNFLGMLPSGGGTLKLFSVEALDIPGTTITATGHGYADGQSVVVWGLTLPTGLVIGTTYYVTNPTADTLKVSLTSGGLPVTLSSIGGGFVQAVTPQLFAGQGVYTLTGGSITLSAVA
jgi:hypothetical protein